MKNKDGKPKLTERHIGALNELDIRRSQLLEIIEPRAKMFLGNEYPEKIYIDGDKVCIEYWFGGGPEDLYIAIKDFLECDTQEKVDAYYKELKRQQELKREQEEREEQQAIAERQARDDEAELDRLRRKYPDKFK